jgi:hypothetical protein
MLGLYENFPANLHYAEKFTSSAAKKRLQEVLIRAFQKINSETLSFEQVGVPTIPDCTIIFEFGIADANGFTFFSAEEAGKLQKAVEEKSLDVIDWFCGIRYYRNTFPKRTPLKFDYYMTRIWFGEKGAVEILLFHERGPRYISPKDFTTFIIRRLNEQAKGKILKSTQ